jgi:integrase
LAAEKNTNSGGLLLRGSTWHMRFSIKGVTVAESTHTSKRRDAERILAKCKADLIEQLVLGKLKPIKLHDAIDEFQRSRAHLPSYKNCKMHLNLFRTLPNHSLDKISDHSLTTVIEKRYAEGYKKSTIGVTVNYFNALVNYCAAKGYTVRKKMTTIKGVTGRIRWLTDEEEAKFFAAIDPASEYSGKNYVSDAQRQENYDLAKLLSHTAARYSEIANMNWSQVDLINGTVAIKRGKGSNDSTIHMTKTACEIFNRRRELEKGDYVFGSKLGRHNETKWVHAAVKRAGLSTVNGSISLHTFRHSRAVKWLQGGMNVLEVQQMLGHKSVRSTIGYIHLIANDVSKKAALLIDNN